MDDVTVALTDDELVAVAVGFDRAWPFDLPSLDQEQDELVAAARRGLRSLLVRDLVRQGRDGTAVNSELAEMLEPALGGRLRGAVSVVDADGVGKSTGLAFAWYESATAGLMECVSPAGTHNFGPCDGPSWLSFVTALADLAATGALASAFPGSDATDGVQLTLPPPGDSLDPMTVVITSGGVRRSTGDAAPAMLSADDRSSLLAELLAV